MSVRHEYGLDITGSLPTGRFDSIILAVAHKEFSNLDIISLLNENGVIYDVKGVMDRSIIDARL